MKAEELKTGFWGYKKFSVYQYITALEESFSTRLLEKDEENRALLEQERQRVLQLEEELRELRQQYQVQKDEHALIASTLVEARRYAEQLRSQAEEREEAARRQLEETLEEKDRELRHYDARLERLRELLQTTLREMDNSAERMAAEIDGVRSEAPDGNMSLFRREPELVG